jgi:CMP-N-acetylneuraminic acid synthetase/spore coat polysaccharide biosynthesis predicted glycosyltransferase SpsG
MRTLAIIPARGGSKGIPRKNLRPLAGKPLLAWAIGAALDARSVDRVVVSTDSDEIARVARRFGAQALMRDPALAEDAVTLDPVIHDAVEQVEAAGEGFDLVLTIQPTSPLLRATTVDRVVQRLGEDDTLDTVLTVVDDTHLAWQMDGDEPVPDYEARVNRQSLPRRFRETGGILATRRACVTRDSRIGPRIAVFPLQALEGIDIDGPDDWLMAEAALGRRHVAFVVIGNRDHGMGHVSRAMTLMESMAGHITRAFCDPSEELAIERLRSAYFPVEVVPRGQMVAAMEAFGADVVVHDELDTDPVHLRDERAAGMKVVCFEDLGGGTTDADLLFNALYPADQTDSAAGRFFGPDVYCLREEFRHAARREPGDAVQRVLITFGGTDPAGLTLRVLDAIAERPTLPITVVAGLGLSPFAALEQRCDHWRARGADIELLRDIPLMSDVMGAADLAFSSAGRTLYELAHMAVPTVVLAQNDLELMHRFASAENGFLFLGRGDEVTPEAIRGAYDALVSAPALRGSLRARMLDLDLGEGRDRVVRAILELT